MIKKDKTFSENEANEKIEHASSFGKMTACSKIIKKSFSLKFIFHFIATADASLFSSKSLWELDKAQGKQ